MTPPPQRPVPLVFQPIVLAKAPRGRSKRPATRVEVLTRDPRKLAGLSREELLAHDLQVIHHGCLQVATWQRVCPGLEASFNITPWELEQQGFWQLVLRVVDATPLPRQFVTLEVVEQEPLNINRAVVRVNLERLARTGIKLALDDVGSGQAVFGQIHRLLRQMRLRRLGFGVSTLKLDRSLIKQLSSSRGRQLIRRWISLANQYGNLGVIAEGVETSTQLRLVGELGATEVQGYAISPNLSAEACEVFLRRYNQVTGKR